MPMHLNFSDSEVVIVVKDDYDFDKIRNEISREGPIMFVDIESRIIIFHTKTWRTEIFNRMAGIFLCSSTIINNKNK